MAIANGRPPEWRKVGRDSGRKEGEVNRQPPNVQHHGQGATRSAAPRPRPDAPGPEPAAKVAPIGPHAADPNRNALGRFTAGNAKRQTHGAYRGDSPTLQTLKQEEVDAILADRGFDATHPPARVQLRLVNALAGGFLILDGIANFIGAEPISGKGRAKRALPLYLQTLDRVIRLAALVGLDRVSRTVSESPREWLMRTRADGGSDPLDVTAAEQSAEPSAHDDNSPNTNTED